MAEALEQWHQVALLELSLINLNKVRESLDSDAPAALQQKLTVAYAKIDAAREFIQQGWIRCPKCKRVSYNKDDIAQKYCANCSKFHDQFDPTTNGDDAQ